MELKTTLRLYVSDKKKNFWNNLEKDKLFRVATFARGLHPAYANAYGLETIDGLQLNVEKPGCKNIFWMTTIVLQKDFGISRDEIINKDDLAKV